MRFGANADRATVVTMFSGCRDEQTSADANIGGMKSVHSEDFIAYTNVCQRGSHVMGIPANHEA
jgi:hypothetical protein